MNTTPVQVFLHFHCFVFSNEITLLISKFFYQNAYIKFFWNIDNDVVCLLSGI